MVKLPALYGELAKGKLTALVVLSTMVRAYPTAAGKGLIVVVLVRIRNGPGRDRPQDDAVHDRRDNAVRGLSKHDKPMDGGAV